MRRRVLLLRRSAIPASIDIDRSVWQILAMRRSVAAFGKFLIIVAAILWVSGFGAVVAWHDHDHHASEESDHAPTEHDHGDGCTVCVAAAAMLGAESVSAVALVEIESPHHDSAEVPESLPKRISTRRLHARDPPSFVRL
jgi:hypothetical protein